MVELPAEAVRPVRNEQDLTVSPDVTYREVEYGDDGTGRAAYRHVIYTEWRVIPDA